MAREFARVKLAIWDDDDFRALPPNAQHLYFLLLTSPSLTYCGTVDWRPARLSGMAGDWTRQQVEAAAYPLAEQRYVIIDESTEEALIRSFIRHDGLMTKPRMAVSMVNAHRAVASLVIRGVIVHELLRLNESEPNLGGWLDTHGKPGAALDLLEREPIDPDEVVADLQSVCPQVCDAFATNAYSGLQRVCTPTTPAPTTATADQQTSPRKTVATADGDASATDVAGDLDRFDEFWDIYAKKVDRKKAQQKWRLALKKPGVTADRLIDSAHAYVTEERTNNEGGRFVMDPARWLANERWLDERPQVQPRQGRAAQWLQLAADLGDPHDDIRQIGGGR